MGNYYTRIVRIYPKDNSTQLNISAIVDGIVKSALLDYELNVYDNKEEKCLDLCWRSKRAGGNIEIQPQLIDVWEIRGGDYSQMFYNGNSLGQRTFDGLFFFMFDELEINYEGTNPEEILTDVFPHVNPNNRLPNSGESNLSRFKINGIYRADNDYQIGTEFNRVNYLERDQFLKLKGTSNIIDGCLSNESKINSLARVIKRFSDFETGQNRDNPIYPGLNYLQLNYKSRPVVKIQRDQDNKYDPWIYQSSNWWDNCILPKWIEYKTERKYTHGNTP